MTALDTKLRASASKLISNFGKSVTLSAVTSGAYDPATRETVTTSTSATVKGYIEDYGAGAVFASGGAVQAGDKKITFAASDVTKPEPGDTVTIDSVVWTVKGVFETWSGEQVATYQAQIRR